MAARGRTATTWVGIASLLVLTACGGSGQPAAAAPAPQPAPGSAPAATKGGISLSIPQAIGEFAYLRRQEFESASMGTMVRYEHPSKLQADVFVYPGPDLARDCDLRCAGDVLKNEVTGFSTVMQGRPDIKDFKVLSGADLTPRADDPWRIGHHLHATVRYGDAGRLQHTDFWIIYLPGYRMKVRSTFDDSPEHIALLEKFLSQVVPAFISSEVRDP